jgi:hypothetical protein
VLRTFGAYIISAALSGALALVSGNAFIQVLPNLRDPEPGSVLFGVLHLVIGTSAAAAAVGVLMRARWAAWSVGVSGLAAVGLLALQPLYEPMTRDDRQAVWLGAAIAGAVALGIAWGVRRLATHHALVRGAERPAPVASTAASTAPTAPAALSDASWPGVGIAPIGNGAPVAGPHTTIPRSGESRAGE